MDFSLTSGERVLWRGAPGRGLRLQMQDWFAVPFAAIWLGLVLSFFFVGEAGQGADDPSFNFILPFFILIGVWMLVGRFIVDMIVRSRTEYVLTDRRAVIEAGLMRRSTRSVNLSATPEIRLQEGRNGRGTIEFGSGSPFGMMFPRGWPGVAQHISPAFELIDDAQSVYAMIITAQREAQSGNR